MNLAELKALYDKSIVRLNAAKSLVDEAKDEAAKATAAKAYTDAKAEVDACAKRVQEALDEAKAQKSIADNLKELEALNTVQIPTQGKGIAEPQRPAAPDETVPAQPKDHEKAAEERKNLFGNWLVGKNLSDGELMSLMPRNQTLQAKALEVGFASGMAVALPPELFAKMLGAEIDTKSIPMLSSDGSAAGGRSYLHWPDYETQLQKLTPEEPSLFLRVTKKPVMGNQYTYTVLDQDTNDFGSVVVSRGTEGSDYNETEIEFKQASIYAYPLNAYTEATKILMGRDRIGMESELVTNMGLALQNRINYEIMHGAGSGSSQCLGLRQDDDVNLVARGTASQVNWADFVNLEHAIRVQVRNGASYCLADGVKQHIKLKTVSSDGTTDRRPLFTSSNMVGGGVQDRLNDRPWFVGTDMSAIGVNGDVLFGNWSHYVLAIEQEAVISRSEHAQFKKGLNCFRIDALVGGRAIHPTAFAVLVGTGGS